MTQFSMQGTLFGIRVASLNYVSLHRNVLPYIVMLGHSLFDCLSDCLLDWLVDCLVELFGSAHFDNMDRVCTSRWRVRLWNRMHGLFLQREAHRRSVSSPWYRESRPNCKSCYRLSVPDPHIVGLASCGTSEAGLAHTIQDWSITRMPCFLHRVCHLITCDLVNQLHRRNSTWWMLLTNLLHLSTCHHSIGHFRCHSIRDRYFHWDSGRACQHNHVSLLFEQRCSKRAFEWRWRLRDVT